jgi:hypothetical protein
LEDFTVKKEDLIKKAAERGIAIDETTAEKYIELSDEELANLEASGGCKKEFRTDEQKERMRAVNCSLFVAKSGSSGVICTNCSKKGAVGCTHPDEM